VVLDADLYAPELDPLLDAVDFPLVSSSFAESYGETGGVAATLRMLLARGARLAAVTRGPRGVVAAAGDDVIEIPAFEVAARDTTGAGDAFHGGFAWALLDGRDAAGCLRAASAVAALDCRAPGAQGALPEPGEVSALLAGGRARR
jgi:sulfofructose kinase